MFVDASALVSILAEEDDSAKMALRLAEASSRPIISPIAIFETTLALARRRCMTIEEAERRILDHISRYMDQIPITPEIGRLAVEARARYGKGTGHPAQLNMGDCFAYACARAHGVPLLYKGADFIQTDLA